KNRCKMNATRHGYRSRGFHELCEALRAQARFIREMRASERCQTPNKYVTPAEAGVQSHYQTQMPFALDSGFRRNDDEKQTMENARPTSRALPASNGLQIFSVGRA